MTYSFNNNTMVLVKTNLKIGVLNELTEILIIENIYEFWITKNVFSLLIIQDQIYSISC